MEINQKYSKDGYSPEIDLKWSGYGSSKLTEMLGLPEDVQEAIPVDATVRDIREAKGIIRETEHNYSDQMELCDIAQPDPAETNWLVELIKQYFSKENREVQNDPAGACQCHVDGRQDQGNAIPEPRGTEGIHLYRFWPSF